MGVPEGLCAPKRFAVPCAVHRDQLAVLLGMLRDTFGTTITCIDGRVHPPLVAWMRGLFSVAYVDLITEPGPDQVVARSPERACELLRAKAALSITRHASRVLVLAGHHDCLANPVSEEEHREHLRQAVPVLLAWDLGIQVVAVWANSRWQIEVVKARAARA